MQTSVKLQEWYQNVNCKLTSLTQLSEAYSSLSFTTFYESLGFSTVLTRTRHWFPSCARHSVSSTYNISLYHSCTYGNVSQVLLPFTPRNKTNKHCPKFQNEDFVLLWLRIKAFHRKPWYEMLFFFEMRANNLTLKFIAPRKLKRATALTCRTSRGL
jgi:hypothetical protein